MIVRPSQDADAINAVVNADAVRPFVGLPQLGYLDFTQAVKLPENLFLMGKHGGFAVIGPQSDVKEVHAFIMPEGRGRWALMAAYHAVRLCAESGVKLLIAQVQDARRDVATFARHVGLQPTGVRSMLPGFGVYAMEIDKCLLQ